MRTLLIRLCFVALLAASPSIFAATEIEGFQIEDSVFESGTRLVLNGLAVRKRGYFKTEVAALYMPERTHSADVVSKTNGVRLIRRIILRDFQMGTAARYFINDFKQACTESEFKLLIDDLGRLGGLYGTISKVSRGDVVESLWTPGIGAIARFNGKKMGDLAIKDELFWQVFMRMYVGQVAPEDFRNGLLGNNRTDSQDKDQTGKN